MATVQVGVVSVSPVVRDEAERLARAMGVHATGDRYDRPEACRAVYALYMEGVLRRSAVLAEAEALAGLEAFARWRARDRPARAVSTTRWC